MDGTAEFRAAESALAPGLLTRNSAAIFSFTAGFSRPGLCPSAPLQGVLRRLLTASATCPKRPPPLCRCDKQRRRPARDSAPLADVASGSFFLLREQSCNSCPNPALFPKNFKKTPQLPRFRKIFLHKWNTVHNGLPPLSPSLLQSPRDASSQPAAPLRQRDTAPPSRPDGFHFPLAFCSFSDSDSDH